MKLIIGGGYQGKLDYALELIGKENIEVAEGETCQVEDIYTKPLIHNFHQFLRRMTEEERDIPSILKLLIKSNPDVVIVSDEIGAGIVPTDAFERKAREEVGRACCILAKEAKEVHRVVAGIGTVIKS